MSSDNETLYFLGEGLHLLDVHDERPFQERRLASRLFPRVEKNRRRKHLRQRHQEQGDVSISSFRAKIKAFQVLLFRSVVLNVGSSAAHQR